ncbi:MAG: hypothetical protein ACTTIZ_03710 [Treponema sp.]
MVLSCSKFLFFCLLFIFIGGSLSSQELVNDELQGSTSLDVETQSNDDEVIEKQSASYSAESSSKKETIASSALKIKIEKVVYKIEGLTKKYPLQLAIPIDKTLVFETEEDYLHYLDDIRLKLNNLRVLESSSVASEYIEVQDNLALAEITISTKDTWNIIALPFPKFDSNTGFVAKLKGKDYNFLGSMQALNLDISYILDNSGKSSGGLGTSFSFPFKAGPLNAIYKLETILNIEKKNASFDLNNTIEFSYPTNFIDIYFGYYQGFSLNRPRNENQGKKQNIQTGEEEDKVDEKPIYDQYFFTTKFFVYTPITLYNFSYAGKLVYTPYISFYGNWAFKRLNEQKKKGVSTTFSHSLSLSRIDWKNNFREGFYFSLDNSYYYNFFLKNIPEIELSSTLTGYYSFVDRVGIYAQLDAFYVFAKEISQRAGRNLRGILNKRIETDMAITLNFDVPIKITSFDFEKISGVEWTRFFGFEWFISFFIDMALVHDMQTNRYFHPSDGWYAGGFEMILYPHRMRSIYFRISLGFDLTELKNVKGINKIGGIAKRDNEAISEIFIGIGLHY